VKAQTRHPYVTLTRWLQILTALRAGEYPTKETLAKRFNVTRRTIQFDIAALKRHFKAPIAFDREQNGFYLTEKKWRLDK
jgi:predicted DNA-binding transcriptional regulator YafY